MIYFDNSASTYIKPKEVIISTLEGLTKYSANPGRSGHKLSILTALKVEEVREKVSKFINAENIAFTQNCTDALNLAIQGTFKPNGHIICSVNDHNASIRPLFELQRKFGLEISIAKPQNAGILTLDDIKPLVKNNTYLICINQMSNVDGEIANIQEIGEFCAEKNIIFCVDGAQSCGHIKLDMQKDHIDLLALAPHKGLYSPQGIGVLGYSKNAKLNPIRFGGTGTEGINVYQPTNSIETFESGTLSTPNILGLGSGIDFVNKNIYFACFLILFIVFIFTFKNIAIMFFASFVIACSINPVVDKFENKNSKEKKNNHHQATGNTSKNTEQKYITK